MKIAALIARILLGLIFVFFGSNGFFAFLPMPPTPPGLEGHFMTAFIGSHWALVISALQVIGGLLLLIGQFIPLGMTILAPIIFNILTYHLLFSPKMIVPGVVCTILWLILLARYWKYFAPLLTQKAE